MSKRLLVNHRNIDFVTVHPEEKNSPEPFCEFSRARVVINAGGTTQVVHFNESKNSDRDARELADRLQRLAGLTSIEDEIKTMPEPLTDLDQYLNTTEEGPFLTIKVPIFEKKATFVGVVEQVIGGSIQMQIGDMKLTLTKEQALMIMSDGDNGKIIVNQNQFEGYYKNEGE
jgi:hypothetical protein